MTDPDKERSQQAAKEAYLAFTELEYPTDDPVEHRRRRVRAARRLRRAANLLDDEGRLTE